MKNGLFIAVTLLAFTMQVRASSQWFNAIIEAKEKGQFSYADKPNLMNSFFASHTLVLFYASTCPHCHEFAPVVRDWVRRHQATIIPLSFDNQPLAQFPQFLPATPEWVDAAFASRPITYPALFVVNQQNHVLYPVAFGSMAPSALEARMEALLAKIKTYERRGDSV